MFCCTLVRSSFVPWFSLSWLTEFLFVGHNGLHRSLGKAKSRSGYCSLNLCMYLLAFFQWVCVIDTDIRNELNLWRWAESWCLGRERSQFQAGRQADEPEREEATSIFNAMLCYADNSCCRGCC